jgi:hypothetical protein
MEGETDPYMIREAVETLEEIVNPVEGGYDEIV